jgi:hypothetical protein
MATKLKAVTCYFWGLAGVVLRLMGDGVVTELVDKVEASDN